ncbi:Protein FAM50-like protein [Smittium culicis]|uniref:Protein FAM50-like protein n=1 Tax=Smittium culicis TaxID=133412 RepID=A0A1R1X3S1_9FUNG|nr:Protein FAM50-like protein [Smittium culicis]OMJ09264.1 Protein FAM50-like protein [Smittium culicis]
MRGSKKKNKRKKTIEKPKLSFELDSDHEEEQKKFDASPKISEKKAKVGKNPNVDTSFLPDKERDNIEREQREHYRQVWLQEQERIKAEPVEITYSYWDGSGHRKKTSCIKGDSISKFLEKCRIQSNDLRGVSVDNLMYIKEDLIIPHHYTFYDFIVNKARGKSGPLFNFDAHEDIRLVNDAQIEKEDSHVGKVCERTWYERNKHIFPASRWELYDPEKNYGSYSIKDPLLK